MIHLEHRCCFCLWLAGTQSRQFHPFLKTPQAQVGPKSIFNVFASALHSASAASCFISSPAPNLTALSLSKLMKLRANSAVCRRVGSCVHLKSEVLGYSSQLGEERGEGRHEMPGLSDWRSGVMSQHRSQPHRECPSPPGNRGYKGRSASIKMMAGA